MKRIQLLSAALIILAMTVGLQFGAPAWAIGAVITALIAIQLALEIRHARRTGEVCGVE